MEVEWPAILASRARGSPQQQRDGRDETSFSVVLLGLYNIFSVFVGVLVGADHQGGWRRGQENAILRKIKKKKRISVG